MYRIMIVVPESDLRRSLDFALAAEGYDVTWRASIAAKELPDFDCSVVDHHALGTNIDAAIAFCQTFDPVILLANSLPHPLSPWAFRTVLKPLLGATLTAAIHDALQARVPTT